MMKVGISFFGNVIKSTNEIEWDSVDVVIITPFYDTEKIEETLNSKFHFKGRIIKIKDCGEYPMWEYPSLINVLPNNKQKEILEKNLKFKDIHKGERVFILCTGPSIAQMDLKKLANERVIATSRFYLHKDCELIAPEYYCIPRFEPEVKNTVDVEMLKAIGENFPKSELFFHYEQKELIDKLGVYNNHFVNYVNYTYLPNYENGDIDLTKLILGPQSVSIMALQIAIYMGFDEIYLIGTEHDTLSTKEYKHFYDEKDDSISKVLKTADDFTFGYSNLLWCLNNLWEQYKVIKKMAERKNIKIYNATIGGCLDIFERVDYDSI
jgi:hypothetical protein